MRYQRAAAARSAGIMAPMLDLRPARGALLVFALLLATFHAVAGPDRPLLPSSAFRAVPACAPIDPFADTNPDREARAAADCDADIPLTMAVRTPRLKPTDGGPSAVELQVDRQFSLQGAGFTGVARLGVQASTDPAERRLLPRRSLLAASGTFRLSEDFALDLGLGHDVLPTLRSRATATAIYRPEGRHLMYVQVAEEAGTRAPAVGMRWQLGAASGDGGGAALDLSARRAPDDSIEPRLGLRWTH
jgi:hypothetical protein